MPVQRRRDAEALRHPFKIDYYDASMEFGSEDPADLSKTTRVPDGISVTLHAAGIRSLIAELASEDGRRQP